MQNHLRTKLVKALILCAALFPLSLRAAEADDVKPGSMFGDYQGGLDSVKVRNALNPAGGELSFDGEKVKTSIERNGDQLVISISTDVDFYAPNGQVTAGSLPPPVIQIRLECGKIETRKYPRAFGSVTNIAGQCTHKTQTSSAASNVYLYGQIVRLKNGSGGYSMMFGPKPIEDQSTRFEAVMGGL